MSTPFFHPAKGLCGFGRVLEDDLDVSIHLVGSAQKGNAVLDIPMDPVGSTGRRIRVSIGIEY